MNIVATKNRKEPITAEGSFTRIWANLFLLGLEACGVVLLYWHGLPLYRQIMADPAAFEPPEQPAVWAISAIALIQAGYWLRYWLKPPLPGLRSAFLGHTVVFAARMSFLLATAVFSLVFISKALAAQMSAFRYVLTLAGLFSLFLFMQELERLGNAFNSAGHRPAGATTP